MKLILIWLVLLTLGCSQKTIVGSNADLDQSTQQAPPAFLNDCSQIRSLDQNLWLLTCQKAPHAERTEIYEYTNDSKKLKRLTFQDGQIWDLVPIDENQFYYASSYDEFKEQFASILSGAKPGSDVYLKNRSQTDFKRMTDQKGLEFSFFWNAPKQLLYFVHETDLNSRIMALNSSQKLQVIYSVAKKSVRNPLVTEKSARLFWIEYDPTEKGAIIMAQNRSKKNVALYKSDSKIFQMALSLKPEQLMIGFATGLGVEIWSLNLIDNCWRLEYRISDPVSEFYIMNEKTLFLTIKNRLKKDSFLPYSEVCHPSPPGLGVTAL